MTRSPNMVGDGVRVSFTPAPWVVNPFNAQVDCQRISDKGGLLPVCKMLWPTDERSEDETEANAHLIAASPTMAEYIQRKADDGDVEAQAIMETIHARG